MSPLSRLLRLTRLMGCGDTAPLVIRHRASGWFVAPDGATDDAESAVQFESTEHAEGFIRAYACEPQGFEVVPADEVARAA